MGLPVQVAKEAKRVVARLDRAEQESLQHHTADPERHKLTEVYSLGHKVRQLHL